MKITAFAASNTKQSINHELVKYAVRQLGDAESELLDLNDYEMPIYSMDREAEEGVPEQAKLFFDKIKDSDAVVISFAEHNGTYTAAYKNVFDWASRIDQKVFQGKPVVYFAASPGPGGATSVLDQAVNSADFFAADVKASVSVPNFYDVFDADKGELTNQELAGKVRDAVYSLIKTEEKIAV